MIIQKLRAIIRRAPLVSPAATWLYRLFELPHQGKKIEDLECSIEKLTSLVATLRGEIAALSADPGNRAHPAPLRIPPVKKPAVSIIIPAYNQYRLTLQCIGSIIRHADGIPFEIIVADDASTDDTRNIAARVRGLRVVGLEENRGFLANCNNAARHARGRYLLLLNNDTTVGDGWLSPLIETLERDPSIGIVGPRFVYPDGRLLDSGSVIWRDGTNTQYGRLDDPGKPEYNFFRDTDYVDGACILIRRELWERVGGFDPSFSPSYFEDTDLAFTVRSLGFRVAVQPKSVVVHHENASHDRISRSSGAEINRRRFVRKWKTVLEKNHFPRDEKKLLLARHGIRDRKRVLVLDDLLPDPRHHPSGRRMAFILGHLAENYHVTVFPARFPGRFPAAAAELEDRGVEVFHDCSFEEFAARRKRHYDIILISGSGDPRVLVRPFRGRGAKLIIDNDRPGPGTRLSRSISREAGAILTAGRGMENAPGRRSSPGVCFAGFFPEPVTGPGMPYNRRKGIIIPDPFDIFGEPTGEDGMIKSAIAAISAGVRERTGTAAVIAGTGCRPDAPFDPAGDDPEFRNSRYGQHRVIVLPEGASAWNAAEFYRAAARGLPAVVDPDLARWLAGEDGRDCIVARGPGDMADAAARLYRDEDLWRRLSAGAGEKASCDCSAEIIIEALDRAFSGM